MKLSNALRIIAITSLIITATYVVVIFSFGASLRIPYFLVPFPAISLLGIIEIILFYIFFFRERKKQGLTLSGIDGYLILMLVVGVIDLFPLIFVLFISTLLSGFPHGGM